MGKKSTDAILIVGSPEQWPDLRYATGFWAADPVVFLDAGTRRLLVVPGMEYGRAVNTVRGIEVATPDRLGLPPVRRRRIEEWALAAVRRTGARKVTVSGAFPLSVARRLERAGLKVCCAEGATYESRAVKRPDEVAKISQAQQAAVLAMREAVRRIAASRPDERGRLVLRGEVLTSEGLRNTIQSVLIAHGCIGRDTIVACGEHAVDPHDAGSGPLLAGQAIVLDIFPQHTEHGYWGDLTRTVVRGQASRELRRMYAAVRAAQQAALAELRPGVGGARVHRAALNEFKRRGFETVLGDARPKGFIHGTGHGVGLAIHEPPSLGLSPVRIRKGHVVTVEPGLYYPGIGGIRIEDTVLVTARGWRYLVPCEKRFEH
ncbi:MAG: aminopeptidase P family protein [Lentisphaerae bacterium]|nr:aminopeptidase P family protein [Lentisphaerota bacterium]